MEDIFFMSTSTKHNRKTEFLFNVVSIKKKIPVDLTSNLKNIMAKIFVYNI